MSVSAPRLDVDTPERVALQLPVAGIGHRCLAYLADLLLLFFFWVVAYFVFTLLVSDVLGFFQGLGGLARTLLVVGLFATQWVYWTASEVLMEGQTPGKRLVGLRVVRTDGSPVGGLECAVRNLARLVDALPVFYAVGCLSVLFTRQHRRLGDLLAGTLLVREERIDLDKYTAAPDAARTAPATATSTSSVRPLGSRDAELILSYLARAPWLEPGARARLGARLVERYGGLDEAQRAPLLASPERLEAFLRACVRPER